MPGLTREWAKADAIEVGTVQASGAPQCGPKAPTLPARTLAVTTLAAALLPAPRTVTPLADRVMSRTSAASPESVGTVMVATGS
jgi:hypothetical protein